MRFHFLLSLLLLSPLAAQAAPLETKASCQRLAELVSDADLRQFAADAKLQRSIATDAGGRTCVLDIYPAGEQGKPLLRLELSQFKETDKIMEGNMSLVKGLSLPNTRLKLAGLKHGYLIDTGKLEATFLNERGDLVSVETSGEQRALLDATLKQVHQRLDTPKYDAQRQRVTAAVSNGANAK